MASITCPSNVETASPSANNLPITRIRFAARDAKIQLYCDSVAYDDQTNGNSLMVLSALGPQTSVKAITAMLQSDVNCSIYIEGIPGWSDILGKYPGGYTIHRHRFEFNNWHILAVARVEGLLLKASEEALWVELRKARFTTPVLRAWVPWLIQELHSGGLMRELRCFGCDSAILTGESGELDEVIKSGLNRGSITIPA